jgi:hypothetical protein
MVGSASSFVVGIVDEQAVEVVASSPITIASGREHLVFSGWCIVFHGCIRSFLACGARMLK